MNRQQIIIKIDVIEKNVMYILFFFNVKNKKSFEYNRFSFVSEFKSRSPTFSEDSGKPASTLLDPHQGQFSTTVLLKKKTGESLGIILTAGE